MTGRFLRYKPHRGFVVGFGGWIILSLVYAMYVMTGLALTLTWDFGVVVYVGIFYGAHRLYRKVASA